MDASRVIVCSPSDVMLFEISPNDLWVCNEHMETNGQHYLELVTTQVLTKEQRIVVFDETEHAHEYVVASEDREHAGGSAPFGTYKCPWSLQHDARLWKVSRMVGTETPATASFALDAALSGTSRWSRGTVTLATYGSASMYRTSGWDALSKLVEVWGGEIDAEVTVGPTGITSRRVSLYAQMGEHTARRRFDYARDMTSITRHVWQDDVACRIIPEGRGEEVGEGYGRRITIESVNGGVEWLQNDESAAIYRLPDGNGGYEYPIVYVENGDIDDPQKLKEWGLSVLNQYTVPKVSYTMEVSYLYHEVRNPYGVGLGDVVQAVDLEFGDTPLRIEARVTSLTINRLDRSKSTVTVSNVTNERSLASTLVGMSGRVNQIGRESAGTAEYIANILNNLNAEINATGGHTYIIAGNGVRTYDVAVSDPLIGAEAHQVTEMKGGTLRFANSKTAQGEWEWKNVITADGYLGLAATIARVTSGYIGSATGSSHWDLDNDDLVVGGRTAAQINDGLDATITANVVEFIQTTSDSTAPAQDAEGWSVNPPTWQLGHYIWQRETTTYGNGDVVHSNPVCVSGRDGAPLSVSNVEYGVSESASTVPSTWSSTSPTSIAKGSWLWIRTTYSDNSTTTTKSYVGIDGTNGTSVTVASIEYGTSNDASSMPSAWSTTAPTSIAQGKWLWVKTTYSDSTAAITKSYVGTDGDDGTSVYVTSSTKVGGTTTVNLSDGTTLTIEDGQDGTNGTAGLNGYVHVAWANSADGNSGFSTTVSTDKKYIGVYTDNTAVDSTSPSAYSWSLIKGADGTSITVSKVEYGTSTSASTAPQSWSTTVPTSVAKGNWLWCRTTYSDNTTTTTKSYVGTDGSDGTSVYIVSSNKVSGTTTVTMSDGTVLTIADGQDGSNGAAGANGYVHIAWANSPNGATDFSTTVSYGKSYIGVYTDNKVTDSSYYSDYSWTLIKGADGDSFAWNLLRHTEKPTNADIVLARATVSDGVVTITPTTNAGYFKFKVDYLDYSEYGNGTYTVSFDARSTGDTSTYTTEPAVRAYLGYSATGRSSQAFSSTNDRYGYKATGTLTTQWNRYSLTFTVPDDVGTGVAEALVSGSNISVEIYVPNKRIPVQVRNVKLERGSVASPWTTAYSDLTGVHGYNSATVLLYQRANSQPTGPSTSLTYRFSSHDITGTLGNWSLSIPDGTSPCWVTAAVATSIEETDIIGSSEWTTPVKLVEDGIDGLNQATIFLYIRSASAPVVPSSQLMYYFESGVLSGGLGSWARSVPAVNGYPCWVTSAVAIANTSVDTIEISEWSTPVKLVEDGSDGLNIAAMTQQYYLSTSSQSVAGGQWLEVEPTWASGRYIWTRYKIDWDDGSTTYSDETYAEALTDSLETAYHANAGSWASVTGMYVTVEYCIGDSSSTAPDALNTGWSSTPSIPQESGKHLWMRDAVTITYGNDSVLRNMNPRLVTSYDSTVTAVTPKYYLSTSPDTATGGSWVQACPNWTSGKYIWTCSSVTKSGSSSNVSPMWCRISSEQSATELAYGAYGRMDDIELGFHATESRLLYAIENAAKTATDYLQFSNGELTIGTTGSAIKNVMTNARQEFRNQAGTIAYFGKGADDVWRLYVQNAQILDMLMFGNYAWITRSNGNMSIKWVG